MWNTSPVSYALDIKCYVVGRGSDNQGQCTLVACNNEVSPYPGFVIRNDNNSIVKQNKSPEVTYGNNGSILRIVQEQSGLVVDTHNRTTTLFCGLDNTNTPFRFIEARIYYCKITSYGNLVRDLLPCLNSNNVPGLYDLVNDVFYPSAGSNPFTYVA